MYQNQLYQFPFGCKFMIVILKSWLNFIGPISLVSQTFTDKQMLLIWCYVAFSVYEWRIIACESSDYRHIVHDDGFVCLMFVHECFSASEQTLNSQNHGVHYMSVITRLACNNSILLTRNSPDWQTYKDDTAANTVLCISGIVLGMTGLRLWLVCIHKRNIRTS